MGLNVLIQNRLNGRYEESCLSAVESKDAEAKNTYREHLISANGSAGQNQINIMSERMVVIDSDVISPLMAQADKVG
jgi:hypothetical protein